MAPVPAALLWDVDGTLAETEEEGHRRAFNRSFADAGLPWRWDRDSYRRLLAISGGRERLAVFLEAAEGEPAGEGRLEELVQRKQHHYRQLVLGGGLALRPGVARLIREAAAAGLVQAIVTTSGRAAVTALAEGSLGSLRQEFGFWICGEEVTAKKPDPEAYRQALDRLGLPAGQVVAVEDSPNGVQAAAAAGVPCLVTLSSQTREEPPQRFAAALAVVEALEREDRTPIQVHRGPACPEGRVTLAYLKRLLEGP